MNDIRSHLICHGIIPNYIKWIWHGEFPGIATVPQNESVDVQIGDHIEEMICDLGQEGFQQAHASYYDKLQCDSKNSLYSGCTTFTRLSTVLALVNLKARFGWSDKSFTELLAFLKNILLEDNTLPKKDYQEKNIP